MTTIAVKKVNRELYRKVKALASLSGRTVGEVVNEALGVWVGLSAKGVTNEKWAELEEERRLNNGVYENYEANLLSTHPGEYAVIAHGKLIGTFKRSEEAYSVARQSGARQAIVARIEKKPKKVVELGWSIVEQLA